MESQQKVKDMGGTMRLGAYVCRITPGTRAARAYDESEVSERHRHRYEVSNRFRETFEEHGLVLSGLSPDGTLVEIVELDDHPWFLGCQFHPELKSRPMRPHPLFREFDRAAASYRAMRRGSSSRNGAAETTQDGSCRDSLVEASS